MADKIVVGAEVRGNARRALSNLEKSFTKFSKSTDQKLSRSNQVFNSFLGNLSANVATAALNKLAGAASAAFDVFITQGVAAAQRQEDAINGLNQALARQGTLTPEVSQEIQDFASELQRTTTVGDETALELFSLSAAFTDNVEKAKLATQAAVELSEVADISLTEATRRVGRAFQGSTEDISKFAPEIRNLTKEQLAAGEAARILVERLGGTAASRLQTFSGVVQQTQNSFGDLQESIGFGITQSRAIIDLIRKAGESFASLTESVKVSADEFVNFALGGVSLLIEGFGQLLKLPNLIVQQVTAVGRVYAGLFETISSGGDFSKLEEAIDSAYDPTLLGRFSQSLIETSESIDESIAKAEKLGPAYNNVTNAVKGLTAAQVQLQNEAQKIIRQQEAASTSQEEKLLEQLEVLREAKAEELIIEEEFQEAKREIEERIREQKEEQSVAEIDALISRNEQLLQVNDAFAQREIRQNDKKIEQILKSESLSAKKRLEIEQKLEAGKQRVRAQELAAVQGLFGALAQAAQLGGRESFEAFKAFSIVEATIAGILAVQRALASAPPPFNFIAAAGVGIATGVNIAKIATAQPPGFREGIDSVPGTGFQDNFPATLAPGERVVPRRTNEDLTQFLAEQSGVKQLLQSINDKIGSMGGGVRVDIGGETVVDVLNRELDAGRMLRV